MNWRDFRLDSSQSNRYFVCLVWAMLGWEFAFMYSPAWFPIAKWSWTVWSNGISPWLFYTEPWFLPIIDAPLWIFWILAIILVLNTIHHEHDLVKGAELYGQAEEAR